MDLLSPATRRAKSYLWKLMFLWPTLSRLLVRAEVFTVHEGATALGETSRTIFPAEATFPYPNASVQCVSQPKIFQANFPELELVTLRDSVVLNNSRFNSVVKGKALIIPKRQEEGPWRLYMNKRPRIVAGIKGQDKNYVAISLDVAPKEIGVALYIGSRGAYNWYHWLANILPALHVANQIALDPEVPVVLPEEARETPQMMESLDVFIGDRPIVWLGREKSVKVRELLWVDSPVFDSPFSADRTKRVPLAHHPSAMQSFRAVILRHYAEKISTLAPPKRVFLARRPGSSRPHNEVELGRYLAKHDFVSVFPEDLSFGEQVALWQHATNVVGMTGAAFTNILLAGPDLRALRLVKSVASYENYFSNLASISGAEIRDFTLSHPQISATASGTEFSQLELDSIVNWFK